MSFIFSRTPYALMTAILLITTGCGSKPTLREADIYTLAGSGKPVIVFQAGLGDDRHSWANVLPKLAEHYTVFSYDRSGSGNNPAVEGRRDPCTIAAEQRAVLRSAGLAPPYILVGHSLGGLYQYAYASLYPQDVAGFVLIDPTHPRNWAEIQHKLPVAATMLKGLKSVAFGDMERREFDDQARCLDRPEFIPPLGMQGRVLVAGRPNASDPEDYETLHLALAHEWPALAGVDGIEMVWNSAHYIQKERPLRVIKAVRQIASPSTCADGCVALAHSLDNVDIGSHPVFDIVFGKTQRNEVERVLGLPRRTYSVLDARGGEVCVYHHKPDKMNSAVGFIPVIGDLMDVLEIASDLQEWRELVVEYDASGMVMQASLRQIE